MMPSELQTMNPNLITINDMYLMSAQTEDLQQPFFLIFVTFYWKLLQKKYFFNINRSLQNEYFVAREGYFF